MVSEGYWARFQPYWDKLLDYEGPDAFMREFAAIPEPAQHIFAAHWCQWEVANSGFEHFFSSDTGVLAPEAVVALRAVGMPFLAAVVERAVALFPVPYPRDHIRRTELLEFASESALEVLNESFLSLYSSEAGGFPAAADRYAAQSMGGGSAQAPAAPGASASAEPTVRKIRPEERDSGTAQTPGMLRLEGVGERTVNAQDLWVGHVTVDKDVRSGPHHHGRSESAIYLISGRARFRYGDNLEHVIDAEAGDFVFVPPYLVHQEINPSSDEAVEMIVSRNSKENIVVNVDIQSPEA